MRALRRSATLLALTLAGLSSDARAARDRLPYHLGLTIDYGGAPGTESWRREIERALLEQISRQPCFASVARLDPGAARPDALELRVLVRDFSEQTTWDVSMATLHAPDAPPQTSQAQTIEVETDLSFELRTVPEHALVRQKDVALRAAYRPRAGEDARLAARLALVDDAARAICAFACKGSPKKLADEIARARQDSPEPAR